MFWGIWHKTTTRDRNPIATCAAATHEEAKHLLTPKVPFVASEVVVEPLARPGEAVVSRFYSDTGPVLGEDQLREESKK
jgi:hypothetical protein